MTKHVSLSADYTVCTRLCLFVIVVALFCCSGLQTTQAAEVTSPDAQRLADQFSAEKSDPGSTDSPGDFEDFDVIPSLPLAAAESNYDLSFRLKRGDYHKLDKGGFAFVFPDGFDLRQISLVTIDDDERKPRYRVEHFSSTRHFLFVILERFGDDDDEDDRLAGETNILLHVESIRNSSHPGLYRIAGLAFDKKRHLKAGPTLSNSFEITGDDPGVAGIVVLPEGDLTLSVGGATSFSAWSVDQSGNVLNEVNASWALSDDSDPIGSLAGSLFTAGSVGTGRVRATFGDFEALSGLITVVSGPSLSYVSGSLTPLVLFAGVETEFSFDLLLDESFLEDVIIHQGSFTVSGVSFSSTSGLTSESGLLIPGVNRVISGPIIVPLSQVGNNLNVHTEILYSPVSNPDSKLTFMSDLENVVVTVESTPIVRIISVESIAFNAPRVNVGQSYRISCRVANLADTKVTSLTLHLSSDGASSFEPDLVIPEIAPGDTVEVFYELVASATPNEHEHFILNVVGSNPDHVISLDNSAFVIVELAADLELSYSLSGVSNGAVHPGAAFGLTVELSNRGEALISNASYAINTDSVDFGDGFDATGTLTGANHRDFQFVAPLEERSAVITFSLTDIPVDLNTGLRAQIGDTSFQFTISVRQVEGDLVVNFSSDRLNLIMPGRSKSMFTMNLENTLEAKTFAIELNSMSVFVLSDGQPVDAASVFDLAATGFFQGGVEVSQLVAVGNRLDFTFHSQIIAPLRVTAIELMAVALKTGRRGITLEVDIADVEAHYFDGPDQGELAPVTTDNETVTSFDYVFKGPSLEQSVVIERNPFNPDEELLHFTYELPVISDIDFRILTLTGEEVYSLDIPFGSHGALLVGENEISWDGRNDKGHTVLNGVYIVFVRIVATGESTLTKVAVVK